jgi:hypothetical protein
MASTGLGKQQRYGLYTGLGKDDRYGLYWTWEAAEIWPLLNLGNSKEIASTKLGKQQRYGLY